MPTYKVTFFNNIHGIEIDINEFHLEKYNLKIGTSKEQIKEFYSPGVQSIIGISQFQNSMKLKTYIYTEFKLPLSELPKQKLQVLTLLLDKSTLLSNALWMVKDNSVRFEIGHLKYTDDIILSVHSNFVNAFYTTCIGKKNSTKYTSEELEEAKYYFDFFYRLTMKDDQNHNIEITHAEVNRITRAYYFIDLARKNYDIGTKVSLYCSAFECLFSVSNTELTHRLSETIANFLCTDKLTKKQLYVKVKTIYSLRSTVTHGSGISKKLVNNNASKLNAIGEDCDIIMRACMSKFAKDKDLTELYFKNKNETIEEYLTDLIFK